MEQHDERTTDQLASVIERFMLHSELKKISPNPVVKDSVKNMCEIELWEMWVLTQDGGIV